MPMKFRHQYNGRTVTPSTVPIYDIITYQGDTFSVILDFPDTLDFTTLTFKAQIRTYPGSPSLWGTFTVTVYDAVLKKLKLSLTSAETGRLPMRSFWDIQATSSVNGSVITYLQGQVFTQREVTDA